MATQYLLPCDCGESVSVSASQAGGQVLCGCGKNLQVPTLRHLRDFPQPSAAAEPNVRPASSGWGVRQGVLTAGLMLAIPLALGSGWFALNEPPPAPEFNPTHRTATVTAGIKHLLPAKAWEMWVTDYRPLANNGFKKAENPYGKLAEMLIQQSRLYRNVLGGAALAVLLGSLLLYAALPR